jgi:hypothetical protein
MQVKLSLLLRTGLGGGNAGVKGSLLNAFNLFSLSLSSLMV